ncbi:neutral alpha-glucosidase C, putative [Entamoeba invadens IP1]|uniref:Glucosidase II subunit alpha n=1 Tax=Entamoeba invadens IP1 TaxID=370355 RepID=A0A0A1UF38_ENTIV|nr:neutral alpha-glucosidase C, putative [Entamoeba invadens IP1]ELP95205.1 neutral alpha-glucosidase C, putative [Entamoeba invadens IP1]|eukprot:XP_004261976.1 neutral alpha-glucosidase C, putative [Entamoeba invadens IP1]
MILLFFLPFLTLSVPNRPPKCTSRTWCGLNRFRSASHYTTSPMKYTLQSNVLTFKLTPTWSVNQNLQLSIFAYGDNQISVKYNCPSTHIRYNVPINTAFSIGSPQTVTVLSKSASVSAFKAGNTKIEVYSNASVVLDGKICIGCDGQFLYREDTKSDYYPVGIDVEFPTTSIFGSGKNVQQPLPLTDSTNTDTEFEEPYHFYASGYTTFPVHSTSPQYGTLPIFVSHKPGSTTGVIFNNPTDTFIDVTTSENMGNNSKIITTSEDGDISLYIILKENPKEFYRAYYNLTGVSFMPPRFAVGFHNSKWGYNSQNVVESVDSDADKYGFMYDAIWLDIEHTHKKQYFTWADAVFPDPLGLQNTLKSKNRYLITIQDCHIATDDGYYVHDEGVSNNYFIKKDENMTEDYVGACWPVRSNWVDFLNEKARTWWAGLYGYDKYQKTTNIVFAWNDMNEPTEFDIQDLLVKKDARHYDGTLHRNVHNLYGMLQQMSTQKGQLARDNNQRRSFVLTRSYYFGSQKYGAMWTGDSDATFEYLSSQISQIVQLNMLGFFCGGDVGGFAHDPTTELLIRWYQAGALQPFFRQHCTNTAPRREPWLYEQSVSDNLKKSVNLRYRMLPYWYSLLYYHRVNQVPALRSMVYQFPEEINLMALENQYMIGDTYLVSPVIVSGETKHTVQLPKGVWYDYFNNTKYEGGVEVSLDVDLETIPIYGRGGYIGTERIVSEGRKSSSESEKNDHLRIVIYDNMGQAIGLFYTDDGISVDNSNGYVDVKMAMGNYLFSYNVTGDYLYGEYVGEIVLVTDKVISKVSVLRDGEDTVEVGFVQKDGKVVVPNFNNHFSSQWTHWTVKFE